MLGSKALEFCLLNFMDSLVRVETSGRNAHSKGWVRRFQLGTRTWSEFAGGQVLYTLEKIVNILSMS